MSKKTGFILLLSLVFFACNKNNQPPQPSPSSDTIYFPPENVDYWETVEPADLGWNTDEFKDLYGFLKDKNTDAFIILKNGKIADEEYFGTFTADSVWFWASAGKTMAAFLTGIAQQEGLIDINQPTSKYIGAGWTSEPPEKENLITIKNQLTMTTGLDDSTIEPDCTLPQCLIYKADAGTRWAYHDAPYTILDSVIEKASGMPFATYFQQKIGGRIGMRGLWIKEPNANNVYYSKARDMARFGLLMLNKGKWNSDVILSDTNYLNSQVNTSQNFNLSYGYLTWLNGKGSYMVPGSQDVKPGMIISYAPSDLYAALGLYDQTIFVVPSQKLVVIRMGYHAAGDNKPALSAFDNELWKRLQKLIGY